MKGVGMQYLEAIRTLRSCGFQPLRSIHISFVPDEEIGGKDGIAKFTSSSKFEELNIGINMDEGLASAEPFYRIFFGERSAWKLIIKATGAPGHGSTLYDGSAFENMCKSLKKIYNFRDSQFQSLRDGLRSMGDVVAINNVYLKAGTPTPSVRTITFSGDTYHLSIIPFLMISSRCFIFAGKISFSFILIITSQFCRAWLSPSLSFSFTEIQNAKTYMDKFFCCQIMAFQNSHS